MVFFYRCVAVTLWIWLCVQAVASKNVSMEMEVNDVHRRLSSSPPPVYQQVIRMIAGGGYYGDGHPANMSQLSYPRGVAVDNLGNVFFAESQNQRVRMITKATGIITTIAGGGYGYGSSGDGGPATLASLSQPYGVAIDSIGGILYISDSSNQVIRRVVLITGIITTYAGSWTYGYSGDGGPATLSKLNYPYGIALDGKGNLYICDNNDAVRLVNKMTGLITTVAGNRMYGLSGNGGAATSASLSNPQSVAVDTLGNFYIADYGNNVVRLVTSAGIITTFAGGGSCCTLGNNGPATSAYFYSPTGVALDAAGNLYISASSPFGGAVVLLVTKGTSIITTFAGGGNGNNGNGDNGPATSSYLNSPGGLAVDAGGSLYLADPQNSRVRQVSYLPTCGAGTYVSGSGSTCVGCPVGTYSGLIATSSGLSGCLMCATGTFTASTGSKSCNPCDAGFFGSTYGATSCSACPSGFSSQSGASQCSMCIPGTYSPTSGSSTCTPCAVGSNSVAGSSSCNNCGAGTYVNSGGTCTNCVAGSYSNSPGQLACTPCPGGFISATGASSCSLCSKGQYSIPGSSACATCPSGQTSTPGSSFCFTATVPPVSTVTSVPSMAPTYSYALTTVDANTYAIPPLSFATLITTNAGNGQCCGGFGGDNAAATSAQINYAYGVALDISGNLYIADTNNNRIRLVLKNTGVITTYAGSYNNGYYGDGGSATQAWLSYPYGVALDSTGKLLYIADRQNNRIRLVTKGTKSNNITTFAGGSNSGVLGDGAAASSASLGSPNGVAVDRSGLVYIADTNNNRIRVVRNGIITTIAGNGGGGFYGDNGPATSASLYYPYGVAIDSTGTFLYIADSQSNRIRLVTMGTKWNNITTYAGNGPGSFAGDGGAATSAQINSPRSVALDSSNNLYIADIYNNRVRLVTKGSTNIITTYAGGGNGNGGSSTGDFGPATSASLNNPQGVALDTAGNLYIADSNNYRVRVVVPQTLCTAGFYYDGVSGCRLCAAGTYTTSTSTATTCTPCPPGTSSVLGSTTCSYCTNGFYSPVPGSTACIPCPTGFASSAGYGATSCDDVCAPGYYSSVSGGGSSGTDPLSCSACSPGTYSNIVGATSCTNCGPGTYSNIVGATSCTNCGAGTYSAATFASFCISCPPGATSSSGSTICRTTSSPTFSPTLGSVGGQPYVGYSPPPTSFPFGYSPTSAPVGGGTSPPTTAPTFSPTAFNMPTAPLGGGSIPPSYPPTTSPASGGGGSSSSPQAGTGPSGPSSTTAPPSGPSGSGPPSSCVAGTYMSNNFGSPTCAYCPPSTYSMAGASACTPCPQGSVSGAFASACTPCPSGSYSTAGAPCTVCPAGSFSAAAGASACSSCPSGQFSSPGASSCSQCSA